MQRRVRDGGATAGDIVTTTNQFVKLPESVLERTDLAATAKLLYATITDCMKGKAITWPGIRTIQH